jgi:hypothetical protein
MVTIIKLLQYARLAADTLCARMVGAMTVLYL